MGERGRLASFIQVAVKDHLALRSKRWLHLPNEFMFLIESTTRLATGSLSLSLSLRTSGMQLLDTNPRYLFAQGSSAEVSLSALGHLFPYTRFPLPSVKPLNELEHHCPSIRYNFNHCPIIDSDVDLEGMILTILNEILLIRRTVWQSKNKIRKSYLLWTNIRRVQVKKKNW